MTINLKGVTVCLGYAQDTSISTASNLPSIPTTDKQGNKQAPTIAVITCETNTVRWRDDGTAPTTSVGMPLAAGTPFIYDGDIPNIKFIDTSTGAILNVSYYA